MSMMKPNLRKMKLNLMTKKPMVKKMTKKKRSYP